MDEDPLTYFLTPASPPYRNDGGEVMDFEMDFDAGIEDSKHPTKEVRSVSPSSLGGFSRPPPLPPHSPSPPMSPATPDLEFDMSTTPDDHDDAFMYARAHHHASFGHMAMPLLLKDFTSSKKSKSSSRSRSNAVSRNLAPPADRGRPKMLKGTPLRSQVTTQSPSRRLSPHAWREPSPDVWMIEEEPEREAAELQHVADNDITMMGDHHDAFLREGWEAARVVKARTINIPAAKPRKKVRFVLPEGYNKDLDMY